MVKIILDYRVLTREDVDLMVLFDLLVNLASIED